MNIFNLKIHQIIHLNNLNPKSNLLNYINLFKHNELRIKFIYE